MEDSRCAAIASELVLVNFEYLVEREKRRANNASDYDRRVLAKVANLSHGRRTLHRLM